MNHPPWPPFLLERRCACMLSHFGCIRLFATLWTIAHKAPLSVGCSGEECWSGLPCPPPEGFPDPGIEPRSPALQADSLSTEPPWEAREKRQCSNIMNTLSGDQEYFISCLHTLWNRASYYQVDVTEESSVGEYQLYLKRIFFLMFQIGLCVLVCHLKESSSG